MSNKKQIKMQMAKENTYAVQKIKDTEGTKTYILKGCYHCRAQFIARKHNALTCSAGCSTSVSHKLTRGNDLTGTFKIPVADIGNTIDFDAYPFRS